MESQGNPGNPWKSMEIELQEKIEQNGKSNFLG
jgi:hypothetical protein